MIELYLGQLDILKKIPAEERFLDKFVYDLLSGNGKEETLRDQAHIFNIDLTIPRVAIAIIVNGENKKALEGPGFTGEVKNNLIGKIKKNILMAIDSFYTSHKDNIISYMGDNVFVVLKDIGKEGNVDESVEHFKKTINSLHYVIKNEIRSNVSIGVGKFYSGVSGLSSSYGEALLAAHLGEDLWGGDAIYHFDNFGVIAPLIIGVGDSSGRFSKNLFSKFNNKEEVLRTLNTFFDTNMSLTETAEKLKIHRNTLVYRLDKINEILGLDPRIFDDAVKIKLAMLFSNFQTGEVL